MAIGEELGLVVNAKGAGKGKVSCVVVQPDGSEVEAEVLENEDGTFDIFYTAPAPGNYVIYVRFGGENIPRSPFKVMVRQRCRISALSWVQHQIFSNTLVLCFHCFQDDQSADSKNVSVNRNVALHMTRLSSLSVLGYRPGFTHEATQVLV